MFCRFRFLRRLMVLRGVFDFRSNLQRWELKGYRISGPRVGVGPGLRASQVIIILLPGGIRKHSDGKWMSGGYRHALGQRLAGPLRCITLVSAPTTDAC